MGLHRDLDTSPLSEKAERTLRRYLKTNAMGGMLRDDIKEKPYILSAWMLSSLALASVLAARLTLKMRTPEVRERFEAASKAPLNLKLFDKFLEACPETGTLEVCSRSLLREQKRNAFANLNHLVEYGLGKLPQNPAIKGVQSVHKRLTRHPMPAVYDGPQEPNKSFRSTWKGAVFALASLANVEPSDIVTHLAREDRVIFEQEYATLQI